MRYSIAPLFLAFNLYLFLLERVTVRTRRERRRRRKSEEEEEEGEEEEEEEVKNEEEEEEEDRTCYFTTTRSAFLDRLISLRRQSHSFQSHLTINLWGAMLM